MYLTKEEEHIYDGDYGWANQVCMKILVRLGELFDAKRLISITSAHVSGVSYKTLGDAPTEFLEALASADARTKVKATLNPQSLDQKYFPEKFPSRLCQKQSRIMECFDKMGFVESLTCTPYYLGKPKKGAHLAWAESSAVVYANSVARAWTNREGGPSALAAAIIGKTPDYGMHKAENRKPKAWVRLNKQLNREVDFGALGIFLGKILGDNVPVIEGLRYASKDNLKQLGAALASTGMVNMFYYEKRAVENDKMEKISAEDRDIRQTIEDLTTTSTREPDLVFVGCPHCSQHEIREIADLIGDKKVRRDVQFWVCTSRYAREKAQRYVEKIERSGGHVLTDTCAVVTWTEKLGIRTIMTNSAKTAHYAPMLNKAETILAPLSECLKTALKG